MIECAMVASESAAAATRLSNPIHTRRFSSVSGSRTIFVMGLPKTRLESYYSMKPRKVTLRRSSEGVAATISIAVATWFNQQRATASFVASVWAGLGLAGPRYRFEKRALPYAASILGVR